MPEYQPFNGKAPVKVSKMISCKHGSLILLNYSPLTLTNAIIFIFKCTAYLSFVMLVTVCVSYVWNHISNITMPGMITTFCIIFNEWVGEQCALIII